MSWIFIVLAHWNNSLHIDMSPYLDTLSWFPSQPVRSHQDFLVRELLLTRKLLNQGFLLVKWKSSFRKFYGRHHDLINHYGISVSQMTKTKGFSHIQNWRWLKYILYHMNTRFCIWSAVSTNEFLYLDTGWLTNIFMISWVWMQNIYIFK